MQAFYSVVSLLYLKHTVAKQLGQAVGNAFVLLLCSQFHIVFYASRPLPNTMALPLVAVAVAQWMQKRTTAAVCLLTFATVRLAVSDLHLTACGSIAIAIYCNLYLLQAQVLTYNQRKPTCRDAAFVLQAC